METQQSIFKDPEIKLFIILALALSIFLVASIIFSPKTQKGDIPSLSIEETDLFTGLNLTAKAVYVYDARTQKVLFAKNEHERLPLASLTKVMASLVAEELSPSYSVVTVSDEALRSTGDMGLKRDEKWLLGDLVDFSLITSSNDGMRAVALSIGALSKANATTDEIINDFVGEMNRRAGDLGLKNTYFLNETGLDLTSTATSVGRGGELEVKGGAYGTAYDMNTLMEYVLNNKQELLVATKDASSTFSSLNNYVHKADNTNTITGEIPGLIASKTGATNTAGGNLVLIFDPELGRPIIISILGSTMEGRFVDAKTLINAVMEHLTTES